MRANTFKTFLLLGVLSAILIGAGGAVAPGALPLLLGLTAAMNLAAWFYSDRLVLRINQARPLDEGAAAALRDTVAELAARAGIPTPRLYLIDNPQPNAFATGRNPEHGVVAVTTGLLRLLPAAEVRGVIAHEIAHIKNCDILVASIAAMLAGAVSFIGQALQFGVLFGAGRSDEDEGSPLGALAMAIVAPMAATLVQLGI